MSAGKHHGSTPMAGGVRGAVCVTEDFVEDSVWQLVGIQCCLHIPDEGLVVRVIGHKVPVLEICLQYLHCPYQPRQLQRCTRRWIGHRVQISCKYRDFPTQRYS